MRMVCSGLCYNRQDWEDHPPDQGDEDPESVQAGAPLRGAPVPLLHAAAGLQGARAAVHPRGRGHPHLLLPRLLRREAARPGERWRDPEYDETGNICHFPTVHQHF